MASQTPGKRASHTIECKYNALMDVDRGGSTKKAIAARYGVLPTTLSAWIRTREAIEEAYTNQKFGSKRRSRERN